MPENEFVKTVTLADETRVNGFAALNGVLDELWVYLDADTDMATAFQMFSDPSKTIRLRTDLTETIWQEWEGYTHMNLIREDAGKVSIRLKKG